MSVLTSRGVIRAILLLDRLRPRRGVSLVGAVAVADQRALEIAEEPLDMVVGAGQREVEHHLTHLRCWGDLNGLN